jgi:hypothetical protein
MGLMPKSLDVTWAYPVKLAGVILCDGGMYLLMAYMAGIGHVCGTAGLQQLLH